MKHLVPYFEMKIWLEKSRLHISKSGRIYDTIGEAGEDKKEIASFKSLCRGVFRILAQQVTHDALHKHSVPTVNKMVRYPKIIQFTLFYLLLTFSNQSV